jgi:hypothetical protein
MDDFKSILKTGGLFSAVSSLFFLTAAIFLYLHTQSFVQSASRTQGKVTKLVFSHRDYFPVYTFKDSRGAKHSIQSLSGSSPAAYQIGDVVPVIYPRDNPDDAEIDTFLDVWIWPIAMAGFGALVLLFGFAAFAVSFFRRNTNRDLPVVDDVQL